MILEKVNYFPEHANDDMNSKHLQKSWLGHKSIPAKDDATPKDDDRDDMAEQEGFPSYDNEGRQEMNEEWGLLLL